jgi:hypothetical protein
MEKQAFPLANIAPIITQKSPLLKRGDLSSNNNLGLVFDELLPWCRRKFRLLA